MATITGTTGNDSLRGTEGADTLVGLRGNDRLLGLGGNDTLDGGPGSDRLDGGPGSDMARYSNAGRQGVEVNLFDGTANDRQGGRDTLISIGFAEGSSGPDSLQGNNNMNLLRGLDGNDSLLAFHGDDRLEGGAGNDFLSGDYSEGSGESDFPGQGVGDDVLLGGSGDDTLHGSYGNDLLDGGAGNDRVDYVEAHGAGLPNAVVVDLAAGTARDQFGGTDRIISVGHAEGSFGHDTLSGNDNINILAGWFGDDTITGRGGADTIIGMSGNDTLDGGVDQARDVFLYDFYTSGDPAFPGAVGLDGSDTVRNLHGGEDVLRLQDASGLTDPTDPAAADALIAVQDDGVDTTLTFDDDVQIRLIGITAPGPESYDSVSELISAGIVELA